MTLEDFGPVSGKLSYCTVNKIMTLDLERCRTDVWDLSAYLMVLKLCTVYVKFVNYVHACCMYRPGNILVILGGGGVHKLCTFARVVVLVYI